MSVHSCSFGELDVQIFDPAKCLEYAPTPRLTVSLVVTQKKQLLPGGAAVANANEVCAQVEVHDGANGEPLGSVSIGIPADKKQLETVAVCTVRDVGELQCSVRRRTGTGSAASAAAVATAQAIANVTSDGGAGVPLVHRPGGAQPVTRAQARGVEEAEGEEDTSLQIHLSNNPTEVIRFTGTRSMLATFAQVGAVLGAHGRVVPRTAAVCEFDGKEWSVLGQLSALIGSGRAPVLHRARPEGWALYLRLFERPENPWRDTVRFCTVHAPHALAQVEAALDKWQGREQELLACFGAKFASHAWTRPVAAVKASDQASGTELPSSSSAQTQPGLKKHSPDQDHNLEQHHDENNVQSKKKDKSKSKNKNKNKGKDKDTHKGKEKGNDAPVLERLFRDAAVRAAQRDKREHDFMQEVHINASRIHRGPEPVSPKRSKNVNQNGAPRDSPGRDARVAAASRLKLHGRAAEVRARREKAHNREAAQCTFQPKVKGVRGREAEASSNGEGDVFQRLQEKGRVAKEKIRQTREKEAIEIDQKVASAGDGTFVTKRAEKLAKKLDTADRKSAWERLQAPNASWQIRREMSHMMAVEREQRRKHEESQLMENRPRPPTPDKPSWDEDAHYYRREKEHHDQWLQRQSEINRDDGKGRESPLMVHELETSVRSNAHDSNAKEHVRLSSSYKVQGRAAQVALKLEREKERRSRSPSPVPSRSSNSVANARQRSDTQFGNAVDGSAVTPKAEWVRAHASLGTGSAASAEQDWAHSLHDVHGGPLNEARHAHVGKAELDHLKRALLAASYTRHGTDLHGLFDRYDRNGDHVLSVDELHGVVQKSLPGIVSDAQLHRIISLMDANHDGRVNFKEFADYIGSRHKHETERELDIAHGIAPKPDVPHNDQRPPTPPEVDDDAEF